MQFTERTQSRILGAALIALAILIVAAQCSRAHGTESTHGIQRQARSVHSHHRTTGRNTVSPNCLTAETRSLLSRLESAIGPVKLVSTCRQGATIRGTGGSPSLHRYGCAFDFETPRKGEAVRLLRSLKLGSVITYRHSRHVHADIGRKRCGSRPRMDNSTIANRM